MTYLILGINSRSMIQQSRGSVAAGWRWHRIGTGRQADCQFQGCFLVGGYNRPPYIDFVHGIRIQKKKCACKTASGLKKCFKTKTMIDFSKDHKFKLQGEAVDDYQIAIEIKRSSQGQNIQTFYYNVLWVNLKQTHGLIDFVLPILVHLSPPAIDLCLV